VRVSELVAVALVFLLVARGFLMIFPVVALLFMVILGRFLMLLVDAR